MEHDGRTGTDPNEGATREATRQTERVVSVVLRGWWIILLTAMLGGAGAFAYSATLTPLFTSTSSTFFSMRTATSGSDINQGSTYTQNQMLSFAELAQSAGVLQPVADNLGRGLTVIDLRRMITLSIPQNTVVLDIRASSADPQLAADVANGVARSLADMVREITPSEAGSESAIVTELIDPAVPAAFQTSPNKQRDAMFGAAAGGLLAVAALAIWALTDTKVRSDDVLRRVTRLPVLGRVPRLKDPATTPTLVAEPNGAQAEAYRGMRSSLRFAEVELAISSILLVSSIPAEGKTTTAVNLALAYAETGARVLLVDLDLRRPHVAEVVGVDGSIGVTTVLVDDMAFDEAVIAWSDPEIQVLAAGQLAPNAAQLLASAAMARLIADLKTRADIVIFDSAPLHSVADATVLAPQVDAVVMVVDSRRTVVSQVRRSLEALASVSAHVAGVVLTRVDPAKHDSYSYVSSERGRWHALRRFTRR